MSTLDCYASERHYLEHLLPVAVAIDGARLICGTSEVTSYARAQLEHVPPPQRPQLLTGGPRRHEGPPVLVASRRDGQRTKGRRLGLLEHGAGQTYAGHEDDPHFAGGEGWEGLDLVLSPGPHAAKRWRAQYPDLAVVELHGSPRLDCWARDERDHVVEPAVVVVSFHWDSRLVPETRSTYAYWLGALEQLALRFVVLGHAHPRIWAKMAGIYRALGIRPVETFDQALEFGTLYVCDNSSTMYEWAGLGRPVLCLDSPKYRRDVDHGLRFWDAPPGLRCGDYDHLVDRARQAIMDEPPAKAIRYRGVEAAYGLTHFDGLATARAVDAIRAHLMD